MVTYSVAEFDIEDKVGVRTLNHATLGQLITRHIITQHLNARTFNHATVNHRPVINNALDGLARAKLCLPVPRLLPASFQLQFTALYDPILDAIKAMIPTAASVQGIEKDLQMQCASFLQGIAGAQPSVLKQSKELKARVQNTADRCLSIVYLGAIVNV